MKVTRQIGFLGAMGLCLVLTSYAFAQPQPADPAVPVERASFHQLVFADEDVAILNNLYPPGGDSGFHTHYRDLFAVIVQPAQSSVQAPGKPLAAAPPYLLGATSYGAVGAQPLTHRVVNGDKSMFQIIVIELRRASPAGKATSSRDAAPHYAQIMDNARIRAWRLILEPGQSVPPISQANKGVRVVVRGGVLTTIRPGLQEQILALRPGDFAIQQAGETRALKNGGTETIELVEVELK